MATKKELESQTSEHKAKLADLQASLKSRAAEFAQWNKERAADLAAYKKEFATRQKDFNTEWANKLANHNKDTAAELKQRQKDISGIKDKTEKANAQAELKKWQTDRANELANLKKEQTAATKQLTAENAARLKEHTDNVANYKKEYDAWTKQTNAGITDTTKLFNTTNAQYQQAAKQRATVEAQAKKLGIDPDEYEATLAQQAEVKKQALADKQKAADAAAIAKSMGLTPQQFQDMLDKKKNEEAAATAKADQAKALAESKARADAEAKQQAEAKAAQQAQLQQYANQMMAKMQQRQNQNYAQTYNILASNMPAPVGYTQGPTSRQAQTTMIDAGGDQGYGGYGQQMSPAQIAQMATMQQGLGQAMPQQYLPPEYYYQMAPQGITQQPQPGPAPANQAPVAVKRGGIIRGR